MRLLIICAAVAVAGCQSLSDATQYAFAPRHYEAPVLMKELDPGTSTEAQSKTGDEKSVPLIIGEQGNYFLNLNHPSTEKFNTGASFKDNEEFTKFAFAYIRVANHKCERREADMLKGSMAQQTGFNLVTTASAVAGSAFSSGNAANAASGAAAFFNSVNSNASAFQTAINGQYSANLLQAAATERRLQYDKIKEKTDKLMENSGKQEIGAYSEISALLSEYNMICTVGRAQRSVNRTLAAQEQPTGQKPTDDKDDDLKPKDPEGDAAEAVVNDTATGTAGENP